MSFWTCRVWGQEIEGDAAPARTPRAHLTCFKQHILKAGFRGIIWKLQHIQRQKADTTKEGIKTPPTAIVNPKAALGKERGLATSADRDACAVPEQHTEVAVSMWNIASHASRTLHAP